MSDESQVEQAVEQSAHTVAMSNRDLLGILALGGITGLIIWGLGLALNRYVFDVLFCQNGVGGQCVHALDYAAGVAVIVGSILALVGLIRLRAYRPLLIVLATAISLWGVAQIALEMTWYEGALISLALYLLAYGAFAWIARVRLFWAALAATIVLIAVVRVALTL